MSNNCSIQRVCIESRKLGEQDVLFLGERSMTIKHFLSLPEADVTTMVFGEAVGNVVIAEGSRKDVYGVYSYNNRVYISKFYFDTEAEQIKIVQQALTNSITYRKMIKVEERLSAARLKELFHTTPYMVKIGDTPVKLHITIDGGKDIPRGVRVSSDIASELKITGTNKVFKIGMLPTKRSFDYAIKEAVLHALFKDREDHRDSRESISTVLSTMKNMGIRVDTPFGGVCIAQAPNNFETSVPVEITISCPEILGCDTVKTYETIQIGILFELKHIVDTVCNKLKVTCGDSGGLVNDYLKLRKTIETIEEKAINNIKNAYKTRLFVGNNIK